jgi:hypothetical protein
VYVGQSHNCLFLFITTIQISQYAKQARNIQNKPVLKVDNAQQELRYLKYCVKAWKMKAIKQKFGELHSNESAIDGICSPLPSLSPMPTRGSILSKKLDDMCLQEDALMQLMQRPDVIAYQNVMNQAIEDKLQVFGNTPKTPKSVLKRLISDCSPYLQSGGTPKRDLRSVRLNMFSNKKNGAGGSTTERAGYGRMSAIEEDAEDLGGISNVFKCTIFV